MTSIVAGRVERLVNGHLSGWAWHRGTSDRLFLVISVNGVDIIETIADLFRPDLRDKGIGDGQHGFSVVIGGTAFHRSRENVIRVRVKGFPDELQGSPFKTDATKITGYLGNIAGRHIHAWAARQLPIHTPFAVELVIDREVRGSALPKFLREDLRRFDLADHATGLRFKLPSDIMDGEEHTIALQVRSGGQIQALSGSPRTFCAPRNDGIRQPSKPPSRAPQRADTAELPKIKGGRAPVCIVGMHRSGTSMITGILRACGLWLGPEGRIMPATLDNQDGHFENIDLVAIGDEMLQLFGGSWYMPPTLPNDWARLPDLRELIRTGHKQLSNIQRTAGTHPWGWKDPRTCIFLPIWREIMPDLKAIVCVRNPMAVARSLLRRDGIHLSRGVELWKTYNQHLVEQLEPGRYIVTHYDAWFSDPKAELRRLVDFLEWDVSKDEITAAVQAVATEHRRYTGASLASLEALGGNRLTQLYRELCAAAGPHYNPPAENTQVETTAAIDGIESEALGGKADQVRRLEQLLALERRKNRELTSHQNVVLDHHAYYRLGQTIDFSIGGNSPIYTRTGWKIPGPTATGITEDHATLTLTLVDPRDEALRLSVVLAPLRKPQRYPIVVDALANGSLVASWPLTESAPAQYDAHVSLGQTTTLRIEFRLNRLTTPGLEGASSEAEHQNVEIHSVKVEPTDAPISSGFE